MGCPSLESLSLVLVPNRGIEDNSPMGPARGVLKRSLKEMLLTVSWYTVPFNELCDWLGKLERLVLGGGSSDGPRYFWRNFQENLIRLKRNLEINRFNEHFPSSSRIVTLINLFSKSANFKIYFSQFFNLQFLLQCFFSHF